jgi:rare lipoprotein A
MAVTEREPMIGDLVFVQMRVQGAPAMRKTILVTAMSLLALPSFAESQQGQTQRGQASYYKGGVGGHTQTKSGEPVNPNENQAASRNLPLGSTATVTNQKTGQSTDVKIEDRGPTRQDRVIDMSEKSANDIGMKKSGTAPVTVEPKK